MTWKQCLLICGLLLSADQFLYGGGLHKPAARDTRLVTIEGRAYTPAEIRAIADRSDRELANLPNVAKMKPVARQMKMLSLARRAVLIARPDPHPESADWLTIATR